MEFTSQLELYKKVLPAFNVKKRLILNSKYKNITNENIWIYLINYKWRNSNNLTLSDIVNDIITVNLEEVKNSIGG
ncbi:MAG: hypothetical protein IJE89_00035 [Bacilli bacterium]|nr:hypothetical protein [Bacilli bacterium]